MGISLTPLHRFHINNILVILSVQLFMFSLVYLGTLNYQLTICRYTSYGPSSSPLRTEY